MSCRTSLKSGTAAAVPAVPAAPPMPTGIPSSTILRFLVWYHQHRSQYWHCNLCTRRKGLQGSILSTKRYRGTHNLPGVQASGKVFQSVYTHCRNWSNPLSQTQKFFSTINPAEAETSANTALLQSGIISAILLTAEEANYFTRRYS